LGHLTISNVESRTKILLEVMVSVMAEKCDDISQRCENSSFRCCWRQGLRLAVERAQYSSESGFAVDVKRVLVPGPHRL
jgi:hypothetical protein